MPPRTDAAATTPRRRKRAKPSRGKAEYDALVHRLGETAPARERVPPQAAASHRESVRLLSDLDNHCIARLWSSKPHTLRATRFDPCAPRLAPPRDEPDADAPRCPTCEGQGWLYEFVPDANASEKIGCHDCAGTGLASALDAADPATADDLAKLANALPHDSLRWLLACCAAELALPFCDWHPAAVAAIETRRAWLRGEATDDDMRAALESLHERADAWMFRDVGTPAFVAFWYLVQGVADDSFAVNAVIGYAHKAGVPAQRIWRRFRAVCAFVPTGGIE